MAMCTGEWDVGRCLVLLVAIVAAGCAAPRDQAPTAAQTITEGRWILTEVEGRQAVALGDGRRPDLRFETAEGRVGGFTGCNVLTARYALEGDRLQFPPPIVTTRRACLDETIARQEQALLGALERISRFTLSEDILTLHDETGPVARFARDLTP
jgi:heat shock protein HslJ